MESFEKKCRGEFLSSSVLAWSLLEQQHATVRDYKPGGDIVTSVRSIADAIFVSS